MVARRCMTYLGIAIVLGMCSVPVEALAANEAKEKEKSRELPKKTVLTTPDGKELLLRDDNFWEAVGNKEVIVDKDFTVPLSDGRIVLVNADGTWGFVNKEVQYAEDMLTVQQVTGSGRGQSIDVNAATDAALKQAMNNAVEKTRTAVIKIKLNTKKLRECIESVEKDTDTEEQFVNGKGWTVTARIILDKGSLLAVVDCARDTAAVK